MGTPVAISASGDHTLLLTTAGLYSFGSNGTGECGQATTTDVQTPTAIAGLSNIVQIAAGRHHSLVLTSSGQILAFGDDAAGELGDGANANQSTPEAITLPSYFNSPPSSIAAGNGTSFVEDAYGNILGAGLNASGQLGEASYDGSSVSTFTDVGGVGMQIAAGYSHTALLYPGYLSLAGDNAYNELDNGSNTAASYFSASGFQNPPTTDSYVGLAAGAEHSLAIDEQGALWGWGNNTDSQLGDGGHTSQLSPILTATGLNLIQVAAGYQYSIGLDATGNIWGWGLSTADQAGTRGNSGGLPPQEISFSGAVQVAAGYDDTLILRDDGTVWAIGDNYNGYLTSALASPNQLAPAQIPGLSNIVAVSTGQYFSLALGSNGTVYSFGEGAYGQLGNGHWGNENTVVTASPISSVTAISAGNEHSLAVDASGTGWAWGNGNDGQNGSTSFSDFSEPSHAHVTGATSPSAGTNFSEFLLANGMVMGLGDDTSNQFNDFQYGTYTTPVLLYSVGPLMTLSAGTAHSIGLLGYEYNGSSLEAWGDDTFGQLGNGLSYPPPPGTPTNFTATLNASVGTEIDLTWTPAGKPASGYIIEESTDQVTWSIINYPPGSATSYKVTGLTNGTTYFFKIGATNGGGASGFAEASRSTAYSTPASPVISGVAPVSNGSMTVTWTDSDPVNNVQSLAIEMANPNGSYTTLATVAGTQNSYTITNLPPGTSLSNIVVVSSNSSGSTASTPFAMSGTVQPAYRYVAIDLGASFIPYKISNNNTLVGSDPTGNLERWTFAGGAVDLTVATHPFSINYPINSWPYFNFAMNNSGQVVATYNASNGSNFNKEGVFWDAGKNDAAITSAPPISIADDGIDPNATTIYEGDPVGAIIDTGAVQGTRSDVEFTSIDDQGTIYGYQLQKLIGSSTLLPNLVSVNQGALGEPCVLGNLGIYDVYTGIEGVTYDYVDNTVSSYFNDGISYGSAYDGFTDKNGTLSPLDPNAVQISGNQFTVAARYPLLASSGTATFNGVMVYLPYNITDTIVGDLVPASTSSLYSGANGTAMVGQASLNCSPVAINNNGDILGFNGNGLVLCNSTGTTTQSLGSTYLSVSLSDMSINSRITNGADDCQIIAGGTLFERSRDSSGNPILPYVSYDVGNLVAPNSRIALQRTTCINDQGWIAGMCYASDQNGNVDADSYGNPIPHGVLLAPVSLEVDWVNRDNPTQTWANEQQQFWPTVMYGGVTAGDMAGWKLTVPAGWSGSVFTWKATDSQGNVINGPSGAGDNHWQISNGGNDPSGNTTLTWRPDTYTIQCTIVASGGGTIPVTFTQKIGWRTEDYVVIGQIVSTDTFANSGPQGIIDSTLFRAAITTDCAGAVSSGSTLAGGLPVLAAPALPNSAFGFIEFASWGVWPHALTPQGPLSYAGAVTEGNRYWMYENALNASVDTPTVAGPSDPPMTTSQLSATQALGNYRLFHHYQTRFTLTTAGTIDNFYDIHKDGIVGKTKLDIPAGAFNPVVNTPPIVVHTVEADTNPIDALPNQAHTQTNTARTELSSYASGRVGSDGQNVNWHVMGQDVPWIFSEILCQVASDHTVTSNIEMSVNKDWKDNGTVSGAVNFNNLNIYKGVYTPATGQLNYVSQSLLPMEGQLQGFISSVPYGTWPTPPTTPSAQ